MKILVIGEQKRRKELIKKIPEDHDIKESVNLGGLTTDGFQLIFDLNFDDQPKNLQFYALLKDTPVFVSSVKRQLAKVAFDFKENIHCTLVGMNAIPGLIDRDLMECTLLDQEKGEIALRKVEEALGWEFKVVADRVGMVTPRVLFMIINEACYTLQEGTASIEDIDQAMKLGTNYPYGPFEWADKIGVDEVYQTLTAIYDDTRDERYRICPLLKTKYLKGAQFY